MANSVVYTGFDPAFGDRLNELIARAKAEGYAPSLISGVRSAYGWPGMKGQSQADLYSQLGKPGGPKAAAPPGYSPHQYGVASDVTGIPQSELERLAPEVGLRAIHSDPNHVELANWRQEAAMQPPPTPWDQTNPANVPSQYAMNMEANAPSQPGRPVSATPIPGGSSHADFIRAYAQSIGLDPNLALGIANAEGLRAWSAKNPNAASGVDIQGGQPFSFGDFQLNVHPGAMGGQALKAGIDPRDPNQWQAADRFALDQMKAGGVGPWKGDPFAKAYLASGAVPALPAMPSTTLNSVPPAVAGGPGAPAAAGQPGQAPGGVQGWAKGLSGAGKTLAPDNKTPADDNAPSMPPPMQLSAQAAGGPMMMGPGGQNTFGRGAAAEQMLAQQAYRGAGPPAAPPILPGQVTGIPGLPGTTLNSPSQLQLALMTGQLSPYDLYGQAGLGGGYGSS